jgi:hypothetical protein
MALGEWFEAADQHNMYTPCIYRVYKIGYIIVGSSLIVNTKLQSFASCGYSLFIAKN